MKNLQKCAWLCQVQQLFGILVQPLSLYIILPTAMSKAHMSGLLVGSKRIGFSLDRPACLSWSFYGLPTGLSQIGSDVLLLQEQTRNIRSEFYQFLNFIGQSTLPSIKLSHIFLFRHNANEGNDREERRRHLDNVHTTTTDVRRLFFSPLAWKANMHFCCCRPQERRGTATTYRTIHIGGKIFFQEWIEKITGVELNYDVRGLVPV